MSKLHIAPCAHKAAKFAVENWHYSKRMPIGMLTMFGAWEDDKFVGTMIYGRGANNAIGDSFGLDSNEVCELVRVAFKNHDTPITRCIAISLRILKKNSPNLRLIISYADPEQGHSGGIYKGGNWIYAGMTGASTQYFFEGRWVHSREITSGAFGSKSRYSKDLISKLPKRKTTGKHKFLMPLDDEMRARCEKIRLDYAATPCDSARALAHREASVPSEERRCDPDPNALEADDE